MQFECQNKIKQFKNWVCNHNIDLSCCFLAEKAILKYCNWELNIDTPSFFIDTILNELFVKYKNDNKVIECLNKYKDISITILQFAICEYNIYDKYNQMIISLCSLFISNNLDIDNDEEIKEYINKNNINIQNELKKILDNIVNNIDFNKNLLESCKFLILQKLEKDEGNNEDEEENIKNERDNNYDINYQLEITRNDSNASFIEAFNKYNFDKDFEEISPKNNSNNINSNNKSFDFGEVSPIVNGEMISLVEEEENNEKIYLFSNTKKFNNNSINGNNNNKDEDIHFLNHKRNIII